MRSGITFKVYYLIKIYEAYDKKGTNRFVVYVHFRVDLRVQ